MAGWTVKRISNPTRYGCASVSGYRPTIVSCRHCDTISRGRRVNATVDEFLGLAALPAIALKRRIMAVPRAIIVVIETGDGMSLPARFAGVTQQVKLAEPGNSRVAFRPVSPRSPGRCVRRLQRDNCAKTPSTAPTPHVYRT